MSRTRTTDMTEGVIWKQLLLFSLPLLAGNLFQQFYNTVDSVVVGNYVGLTALGAVTSTMPAINTLIGLFMGMTTGASVVISQYFGAHNEKALRSSIHTSLVMTAAMGFVLTFVGYFLAPFLVRFMNTPESVAEEATIYLRIYFSGIIGLTLYNMGSAILRAVGDSRRPLYFLIFSSLLNIVLDLAFVIGLGLGVAGVAYATILSQFISAILVLFVLVRSREIYRVSLKELRAEPRMIGRIAMIGLPGGLQMAVTSFSNVFVQGYINRFGAAATAGWGAYFRVDSFVILPMMSIGLAVTTFVGQNAGAGRYDRIREGVKTAQRMALFITIALCAIIIAIAPSAIGLFNRNAEVLYFGTLFLRANTLFDFIACNNQVYAGAMRGMGDTTAPMVIMLFSFVLFRQIYLFAVTHFTDAIIPVAVGYPVGWLVCSILMMIYYYSVDWEKRLKGAK